MQSRLPSAQLLYFTDMQHSYYTLSIILGTVALSYGSVPMYKMICQQTGWGGQPIKSAAHSGPADDEDISARLTPITTSRRLRITFAGSTSDILPWKFTPQQREVRVLPGETALAFYTATNKSPDEDIIGVATYSVTPAQVAPYFSKIQCFCFEEQRLNRGETVDMPVFFYIDPDFLKDPNMRNIDTITLNYTFFSKYPLLYRSANLDIRSSMLIHSLQRPNTTKMGICRLCPQIHNRRLLYKLHVQIEKSIAGATQAGHLRRFLGD